MAISNYTLQQDYIKLSTTHQLYLRWRDRWQFLYQSYVGGMEYQNAGLLTRYQLETDGEYNYRLRTTPLPNHCAAIEQTYISFLFKEHAERDFGSWEPLLEQGAMPDLEAFLADCDYEGRSFDDFMKQVAIWAGVFGHCWIFVTKPNIGAATQAQEMEEDVRPYVNLVTPLVISDWRYERRANGKYELVYVKYIEEVVDKVTTVKVWTPETIETWIMYDYKGEAEMTMVETNQLGMIPAVLVYNQRSIEKGIGVSDFNDIADLQRMIYNMTSECEQGARLGVHPTLVIPPTAQIGAGAGAMIQLMEGSDPGLNPYAIEFGGAAIDNLQSIMSKLEEQIEKLAHLGGVRATATRQMSGIALETEMTLLAARLSEKADNLQLAEEQIWKLFAAYTGREWDGEIEYPDNFMIRDDQREMTQLKDAKTAASSPEVLALIDQKIMDLLGESEEYEEEAEEEAEPAFQPHSMTNPLTGETQSVTTVQQHEELLAQGWLETED